MKSHVQNLRRRNTPAVGMIVIAILAANLAFTAAASHAEAAGGGGAKAPPARTAVANKSQFDRVGSTRPSKPAEKLKERTPCQGYGCNHHHSH
jgi:hypothetical protein